MANTHLLAGMRCPACGSAEPFRIEAVIVVLVHDAETEDLGGEYAWEPENHCECVACDHHATIKDFTHLGG
jgi:Zn ribbon nucleic-acid-binding protein